MPHDLPSRPSLAELEILERPDGCTVSVFAKPRARKSQLIGIRNGRLEVALAAPPSDGEANAELTSLLATLLALPRRDVTLVRGSTSKAKQVHLRGLSAAEVRLRIGDCLRA